MYLGRPLIVLLALCLLEIVPVSQTVVYGQQAEPVAPPRPDETVPLDPQLRMESRRFAPVVIVPESQLDVLPSPTMNSGFGVPEGLKTAPEILIPMLGYGSATSFPLTPRSCFEVARKCYANGLYADALAFANHGLKLCNHARLYLLKSLCEMNLGRTNDATDSIVKYRVAMSIPKETIGLREARDRLNGPMLVRIEILMAGWQEMNNPNLP